MDHTSAPPPAPPPAVAAQIAELRLVPNRPLIAVDADEVLFYFMRGLESALAAEGLYFTWNSFALLGNIRHRGDDTPLTPEACRDLLDRFFTNHTAALGPVDGAAGALERLSRNADIVVLSNVPLSAKAKREEALTRHGMPYPVVANTGPKGPAMAALVAHGPAAAVFIDDIPQNHASVAAYAPEVQRLHFVADPRLAALLPPTRHSHARLANWEELEARILQHIGG